MALLARDSAVPSALVALTVFRAPAWACLICFTSYKERTRICQIFVGTQGPQLEACQEAFSSAFADLADTEINYDERSHLRDAFTQMTHSLQEIAVAQGSFKVAFLEAAKKMQKVIMELKGAQACVPPCGFQDVARRFVCFGCYSKACNLPLDCPVQDLTVTRGQQAKFSCTVNFQLPKEEITYSWRFAGGGVRTQDQSYFRDIPRAQGYLARIRPVQPTHSGTFSCSVLHDQRPVARLYFFLNESAALEAAGDGVGAMEAQPERAAGQARSSDAGQPVPARGPRGHRISQCDPSGVDILSMVLQEQLTKVSFSYLLTLFSSLK
ncbi:sperm acrosome membrane-associated protein 6 isoform X2 [Hyaena hyaena]|uniref:sperm acrosome membrane-associated protein 6 isoform X2 n=1 Tax=Hyaena hyaena TaxID=95912 RepID=UPI001922692B|nr:sperm acrosome membrane-associated protein 6 isoform X2 [Hyaena hyaena]